MIYLNTFAFPDNLFHMLQSMKSCITTFFETVIKRANIKAQTWQLLGSVYMWPDTFLITAKQLPTIFILKKCPKSKHWRLSQSQSLQWVGNVNLIPLQVCLKLTCHIPTEEHSLCSLGQYPEWLASKGYHGDSCFKIHEALFSAAGSYWGGYKFMNRTTKWIFLVHIDDMSTLK